jgi:hypothetical protein
MKGSSELGPQTTNPTLPVRNSSTPGVRRKNLVSKRSILILGAFGVAVLLVVSLFAYLAFSGPTVGPRGPSLGPGGLERRAPGAVGCSAASSEVCYTLTIGCTIAQLPISNLFFAASNASAFSYPISNSAYLGPGAKVTVLNGTVPNGVWNVSTNSWTILPVGDVPVPTPLILVLDTGVFSNTSLLGEWFFVEHSAPSRGYLGFALGYS